MPRKNIPAHTDSALELANTAPIFLVHIDMSETRQVRMAAFDDSQILSGDQLWWPTDLKVVGPSQKAGVNLQATITVPFDAVVGGDTWTDSIRNVLYGAGQNRPQDRPAKLYQTFFHRGVYLSSVCLLDGVVDSVDFSSSAQSGAYPTVTLVLRSRGVRGGLTPNIRIGPPLLNRVTPPGSTLLFDNTRIKVE